MFPTWQRPSYFFIHLYSLLLVIIKDCKKMDRKMNLIKHIASQYLIIFLLVFTQSTNAQNSLSKEKVVGYFSPSIKAVSIFKEKSTCRVINSRHDSISMSDSCDITLINEGDLNNDGFDDLTIVSAPLHGCTYNAITYDLSHTQPKILVPLFMVETECEALLKNELKALVGTEKDKIYHIESDVNDENFRKIKVFNRATNLTNN